MNNISDKLTISIIFITILLVFSLIFSVKSPERKLIESPIIWNEEFPNTSNYEKDRLDIKETYHFFNI